MPLLRSALAVCALALLVGAPVRADDAPPAPETAAPIPRDVGDLWRLVRHKDDALVSASSRRFVVVAPTITSKPSTGLTGGLSSNVAFFAGDQDTTRLSSMTAAFKVSEKGQVLGGGKLSLFTGGDRWFIQTDGRAWSTSLNTFALGSGLDRRGEANLKYDWLRAYETTFFRIDRRVYVGGGVNVSDHRGINSSSSLLSSSYAAYSTSHGFSLGRQVSSGVNVGAMIDSRDSLINPSRGTFATATYRAFVSGFAGGTSTWQELNADARAYHTFAGSRRQTLAVWLLGDFVTGGSAPYLDLPGIGGDGRSGRGYSEGRYRGPQLVYEELEYRASLVPSGLVGFVLFQNVTTVSGDTPSERLFRTYAPAGGTGLRVLLNKHSKTNLCVDYGWGKQGSRGLYLAIQEAF